ncbi:MAG: YdeI/OmpD-associated family protein [Chitinophagaceae bacterium]
MAIGIAQKLKIKEGSTLLTINAPKDFKKGLGELPAGVKLVSSGSSYAQIHWFVLNKAQADKELPGILKLLKDDVLCWIYYPKSSSGIQTDLTRDKGWDNLLKQKDLHWITLVSFNDTWSAFAMRLQTTADKKKAAEPKKERAIFDYIDAKTKTIHLPEDLTKLLSKNKKAAGFFETLSFSNRKEYVEWIVTAKRPETRAERLQGTIERLEKQWKNPRNQ